MEKAGQAGEISLGHGDSWDEATGPRGLQQPLWHFIFSEWHRRLRLAYAFMSGSKVGAPLKPDLLSLNHTTKRERC